MKKSKLALLFTLSSLLVACGGSGGSSTPSSASSVAQSSSSSSSVTSSPASSASPTSSSLSSSSSSSVSSGGLACELINQAQGFASIDDDDNPYVVTGGADVGEGNYEITVTDGVALRNAVYSSSSPYRDKPLTIYIGGLITWENSNNADIRIERSNVSIIGLGDDAGFEGVGIELKPKNSSTPVENIIIRNLKMRLVPQTRGAGDIISLDGRNGPVRNIWIDHNELHNSQFTEGCTTEACHKDHYDELVSGRADVSNITISYNYLHDSWKTSLWGSSDNPEEDVGRRVTFHHNYWDNVNSRLPLYRYGILHMFNNYYHQVTGSGINVRMGARALIDGNVFEIVKNPIVSIDSSELGYWTVGDDEFANSFAGVTVSSGSCTSGTPPCYGAHGTSTDASPYLPPYDYSDVLLPTADTKEHVMANAGVGKIDECL